jgi:hypothetical protein
VAEIRYQGEGEAASIAVAEADASAGPRPALASKTFLPEIVSSLIDQPADTVLFGGDVEALSSIPASFSVATNTHIRADSSNGDPSAGSTSKSSTVKGMNGGRGIFVVLKIIYSLPWVV